MINLPPLPITEIFGSLHECMKMHNRAVIVAPPGAGKTTLIPLFLLDKLKKNPNGKIILLEPRRLATRAAARRMADLLGESLGQQVGYIMRMDQKISKDTRIIVVTEGVFVRMVLDDPELNGISAVIFDEFHERNIDADFGLALAIDVQEGLRNDLKIIVMSATLDGARVASLLDDAQIIESKGRSYNVDIRYSPKANDERIEDAMSRAIIKALKEEDGSILAFLPGQGEIERTKQRLQNSLGDNPIINGTSIIITPLFGTLDIKDQDNAILPAQKGSRKVVLATSIAESSITIEDVRIVIDSGLARVPIFEPASGLTRLETVRASRASIDQRAGRAGRTQTGIAIRLWLQGQNAALPAFATPEILNADLSNLVLDCLAFGVQDPANLRFLNPPPLPSIKEARDLLIKLDAIDENGRLTLMGQAMRALSLPVRYSHMVLKAAERGQAQAAAELALLLVERGLGGNNIDIDERLRFFQRDRSKRAQDVKRLAKSLADEAAQLSTKKQKLPNNSDILTASEFLMDAWPDRIAKARGKKGQFLLCNGRGAYMDAVEPLANSAFLVIAELTGSAERTRILAAANLSEDSLYAQQGSSISQETLVYFDEQSRTLRALARENLGAISLSEKNLPSPKGDIANQKWLEIIQQKGLSLLAWSKDAKQMRQRLFWLFKGLGEPWPDVNDDALLQQLDEWLLPFLNGKTELSTITSKMLSDGLYSLIPYHLQREFNALAPTHFTAPTGSKIAIDYEGEEPTISLRVQELYGLITHPTIAGNKIPLIIELLSPAHRPIQITRDLPSFWAGSWKDVRSDMRGRYPKHLWPENPAEAMPTTRAKPRGS